jgi:hypothetical protein
LSAARRLELHARIAEIIEAQAGPDPERSLSQLAHHFYRGLPRSSAKAFTYCLRAARAAQRLSAHEQACTLYEHALEAWAFQDEAHQNHFHRCLALLGLAQCFLWVRRQADARSVVAEALRTARALGRPDLVALGVVLANIYATAGQPIIESVRDATEEALRRLPDGLPAVRAYLLSRIACDTTTSDEKRRALAVEAMELVCARDDRSPGDDLLTQDLALMRGEATRFCLGSLGPKDLGLCIQLATRVIDVGKNTDLHCAWVAHRARAKANLVLGDLVAADRDLKLGRAIAGHTGSPVLDFEEITVDGYRALLEGKFAQTQRAINHLNETILWPSSGHRAFLGAIRRLALELERGDLVLSPLGESFRERLPDELVDNYQFTRSAAEAVACHVDLVSGHADAARRRYESIAANGLDGIARDDFYLVTMCDLAVLCCGFEDRERAEELYDRLAAFRHLCVVTIPMHYRGPVAHFLGMLARLLGRLPTAIEHFELAATVGARLGALPTLNRTRLALATALATQSGVSSRARASALVEDALASAKDLRMARVCAELEQLRASLNREVA